MTHSAESDSGLRFVFKYALDPATGAQHAIPYGSRFLDLQMQDGVPVMWWSVPHKAGEPKDWPLRTFSIVPTGGPGYVSKLHYMATFQLGGFVGHVFAWEPFELEAAS